MCAKFTLSHRIEYLALHLSTELEQRKASLLSEQWILLPSQACKQWLSLELAKHKAIAGLCIMSWREALLRLSCQYAHVANRLELQFALAEALKGPLPAPISWVNGKSPAQIARLSSQWAGQMCEMGFYGLKQTAPWQTELWNRIHQKHGWQLPADVLPYMTLPESIESLHCFCLDELPPLCLQFLLRVNASFYAFSPCCMFWEDLYSDKQRTLMAKHISNKGRESMDEYLEDTHPLLANWGKLGRSLLKQIDDASLELVEAYEGAADLFLEQEQYEQGEMSLLQMVQHDLLHLKTTKAQWLHLRADPSIQLLGAGSSSLREIQILKDQIFLELDRGTLPSEMLVLAPDIRTYESAIRFVFGSEIPNRIAPTSLLAKNRLLQGCLLFFSLTDGRWEADSVIELFENRAFRNKHNISDEDLQTFHLWMDEAKIRDGKENWKEGISRIARGLVFLLPKEEGPSRISSIDWSQAQRFERFLGLLELLQTTVALFGKDVEASLQEWQKRLTQARNLFKPEDGEGSSLDDVIRSLPKCFDGLFPFAQVRAAIEEECKRKVDSYQSHVLEAVEFASMQPGSLRPAETVFLLGMEEGNFPRKRPNSSLDWKPLPDDADHDRYLLLQALFAARGRLIISYRHLSPEDGKTRELSLAVQELQQTIERFYDGASLKPIVHPTLPYDERYFKEGLCTYSQEAFQIASCSKKQPSPFWPRLKPNPLEKVSLSELLHFARNPWKAYLRKMGIYLKEEKLFSEQRMGEATLPIYRKNALVKLALHRPLEEVLQEHAHEFPRGALGELSSKQISLELEERLSHFDKWGLDPKSLRSIPLKGIVISGIEITGSLEEISGHSLVVLDENDLSGWVRNWPAILVASELNKGPIDYCSCKQGRKKTFEGIDPKRALEQYLEYYRVGQEILSPLIKGSEKHCFEQNKQGWLETIAKYNSSDDPIAKWMIKLSLDLDKMWEEWSSLLPSYFTELSGG